MLDKEGQSPLMEIPGKKLNIWVRLKKQEHHRVPPHDAQTQAWEAANTPKISKPFSTRHCGQSKLRMN